MVWGSSGEGVRGGGMYCPELFRQVGAFVMCVCVCVCAYLYLCVCVPASVYLCVCV